MRILRWIYFLTLQVIASQSMLFAQDNQDSLSWYQLQIEEDLPLEEAARNDEPLIYSATRQLDSLKTLASQVNMLTYAEMKNAGVTNIPEALQLLPEFVVKAKANGIYDVEYRGASAPANFTGGTENLLLLINAQPFNDALSGEIWWEALPFTIDDLDHIELIRMPHGTWFGYGGALAVINLVTRQPSQINGTVFTANLQAGTANTHQYHVGLGMKVNEKLSGRIGAYFQRRNRFQDDFYVSSLNSYIVSDSVLFYQPEALRTNPKLNLAQQSRGFNLSSSYRWSESIYFQLDAASQNSEAQAPFSLNEELRTSTRSSQTQTVNMRFRTSSLEAQAFYYGGNQDLAAGYAGMQYRLTRMGARANYHKKIGRYALAAGGEWLGNSYENPIPLMPGLPLSDSLQAVNAWKENLLSIYLQQKASFLSDRLLLESGQRIYQSYQEQDFPIGYHVSLRWFLTKNTSLRAGTAQVLQATNQVFGDRRVPIQLRSHSLGISQQINRKQGDIRLSFFNQQSTHTLQPTNDQTDYELPLWGGTLETNYKLGRTSLKANSSWFSSNNGQEPQLHPSLIASLQINYATYFDKLNLRLGFFYNSQHQNIINGLYYEIPEQWLLNSKFSYRVWKDFQLFVSARNLLNNQQYYVPQADLDNRLLMLGLNINLQ